MTVLNHQTFILRCGSRPASCDICAWTPGTPIAQMRRKAAQTVIRVAFGQPPMSTSHVRGIITMGLPHALHTGLLDCPDDVPSITCSQVNMHNGTERRLHVQEKGECNTDGGETGTCTRYHGTPLSVLACASASAATWKLASSASTNHVITFHFESDMSYTSSCSIL